MFLLLFITIFYNLFLFLMKSSVLFYEKSVKKRQIWEGGSEGPFLLF